MCPGPIQHSQSQFHGYKIITRILKLKLKEKEFVYENLLDSSDNVISKITKEVFI